MSAELLAAIIVQIPLVAAVVWAYTTGKVHSPAEMARREKDHAAAMKRREDEHSAELQRRQTTLQSQVDDWRTLYQQERSDRIKADDRLTTATGELKEVTGRVEELTREVIRSARP